MSQEDAPAGSRALVLSVVLLAAFATNLTLTVLTIAVAPIAIGFRTTVDDAAWVTIAPMVVTALLTPAAGAATDRIGRTRVFRIGLWLSFFGFLTSGLAPSLPLLIAARILTGAGTAAVLPSGLALAAAAWPPAERATPVGAWTATLALAPALGVLVGGFVVEQISWRWLFFAQVPVAGIGLLLAARLRRDVAPSTHRAFDGLGALLLGGAVFGLLLGVNRGSRWGWGSAPVLASFLVAALAIPWLVRVERRAAAPVIPLATLRDPPTRRALGARAALSAVYLGSFLVLPLMLLEIGGHGTATVALMLAPRPIAMGLTGAFAGRLASARTLAIGGAIAVTTALVILVGYEPTLPYPLLLLALVLKGVGLGLSHTATGAVVTGRSAPAELGATSGTLAITSTVAASVGMALMLSLVTAGGGVAVRDAYRLSFAIGLVLSVLGLAASIRLAHDLERAS